MQMIRVIVCSVRFLSTRVRLKSQLRFGVLHYFAPTFMSEKMYIKQAMANKTRIGLVLRCCRYTDDKFKASPSLSVTIQFSPGNVKHRYLEHISFNKPRMKLWYLRIVVDMRAMAGAPRLGVVWLRNMLHVLSNFNFWLELLRVFLLKCEEWRF